MKIIIKGMLELVILHEALTGASGKQIKDKLKEITGGAWNPSPGSIYPLLEKLEKNGWIREIKDERKENTYKITAKGRRELEKEKKDFFLEAQETAKIIMPLMLYVHHDFSVEEMNVLRKRFEEADKRKMEFLGMPTNKRKKIMLEGFKK